MPNTERLGGGTRSKFSLVFSFYLTYFAYEMMLYTKSSQVIMAGTSQAAAVVLLHSVLLGHGESLPDSWLNITIIIYKRWALK